MLALMMALSVGSILGGMGLPGPIIWLAALAAGVGMLAGHWQALKALAARETRLRTEKCERALREKESNESR